jgi:putative transposase
MRDQGLIKRPRRGPVYSPGAQATEHRIEGREIRSYESEYVNALWHLDFHHGSLRVLLDKGRWVGSVATMESKAAGHVNYVYGS